MVSIVVKSPGIKNKKVEKNIRIMTLTKKYQYSYKFGKCKDILYLISKILYNTYKHSFLEDFLGIVEDFSSIKCKKIFK